MKSADIKPYNEALQGFESSCGCSVKTLDADGRGKGGLTEEIHRLHPDMVLAIGMDALSQLGAVEDLPLVYVMVPGPLFSGGRARNISGVSMYISPSKYLDAMTKLFPGAGRIGLVYDPKNSGQYVKEAMKAAAARGINLIARRAGTAAAVPSAMDSLKQKIDIFWMLPESSLLNSATIDYMLLFSFENKVPIFTFSEKYVEMGAAAALTVDSFDMGAQAGEISRKLNASGSSAGIRVDADVSRLVVNRKVLNKLGINMNARITRSVKNVD